MSNKQRFRADPLTPEQAIKLYHSKLTKFEQNEINLINDAFENACNTFFTESEMNQLLNVENNSNKRKYQDDQLSGFDHELSNINYDQLTGGAVDDKFQKFTKRKFIQF